MKCFCKEYKIGDHLICPVCGKEFIANTETQFIARGDFTCSKECFFCAVNSGEIGREFDPIPIKKKKRFVIKNMDKYLKVGKKKD